MSKNENHPIRLPDIPQPSHQIAPGQYQSPILALSSVPPFPIDRLEIRFAYGLLSRRPIIVPAREMERGDQSPLVSSYRRSINQVGTGQPERRMGRVYGEILSRHVGFLRIREFAFADDERKKKEEKKRRNEKGKEARSSPSRSSPPRNFTFYERRCTHFRF